MIIFKIALKTSHYNVQTLTYSKDTQTITLVKMIKRVCQKLFFRIKILISLLKLIRPNQ